MDHTNLNLPAFYCDIDHIFKGALRAVDPFQIITTTLLPNPQVITPNGIFSGKHDLNNFKDVLVVGCGKAAASMAQGIEYVVGKKIQRGSVITVKDGYLPNQPLKYIKIKEAGHPIPDQRGVEAAQEIISVLTKQSSPDTLVIALISGGGSSLWCLPENGIELSDKIKLSEILLESGATISEINYVRKAISGIKGGKAALYCTKSPTLVLEISDVIHDDISTIASGPFCIENKIDTITNALNIIDKYDLSQLIPRKIGNYLSKNKIEPDSYVNYGNHWIDDNVNNVTHCILANNSNALKGASDAAQDLNYSVIDLKTECFGEASLKATNFVKQIKSIYADFTQKLNEKNSHSKVCVLSGGETTVTLPSVHGLGGRNLEFALTSLIQLSKQFRDITSEITLLSCGTDGTDGPTDAAGAVINLTDIKSKGYEFISIAENYLKAHDSYNFFKKYGTIYYTGPTNTNVMDIQIALIQNIR